MKNKTGSKTQGKSASGTRMSIILRFLAGSQPEEIQIFLDLLFEPVKHFKNGSYQLAAALHACCLLRPLLSQAVSHALGHLSKGVTLPNLEGGLFADTVFLKL